MHPENIVKEVFGLTPFVKSKGFGWEKSRKGGVGSCNEGYRRVFDRSREDSISISAFFSV